MLGNQRFAAEDSARRVGHDAGDAIIPPSILPLLTERINERLKIASLRSWGVTRLPPRRPWGEPQQHATGDQRGRSGTDHNLPVKVWVRRLGGRDRP